MNYTKTSFIVMRELISKINNQLNTEKHVIVSDLDQLEHYFADPVNKTMEGSLTLTFSAQKRLPNGTAFRLTETVDINKNECTVTSEWQEENSGELCSNTECYIAESEPEAFIPYQIKYAINAIVNILSKSKGTFQIKTRQFSISSVN
jgi:hypothetical protein